MTLRADFAYLQFKIMPAPCSAKTEANMQPRALEPIKCQVSYLSQGHTFNWILA